MQAGRYIQGNLRGNFKGPLLFAKKKKSRSKCAKPVGTGEIVVLIQGVLF